MSSAPIKKPRSLWLELWKVFLAFGIVWIHFGSAAEDIYNLARIGVLMFFAISGCFCYSPKREGESEEDYYARKLESAKKKIFSTLSYLCLGYLFCLCINFVNTIGKGESLIALFKSYFYDRPFYAIFVENGTFGPNSGHLWFIEALLTVSIIHYLLVRFKKEKLYAILPLLLIVFFYFAVYVRKVEGGVVFGGKTRNGLFMGLPMFALGYLANYLVTKYVKTPKVRYITVGASLVLGLACFFLQLFEKEHMVGANAEGYIFGALSSVLLLPFFLLCPSPNPKWYHFFFGKNLSFSIYMVHYPIGLIYKANTSATSSPELAWRVFFYSFLAALCFHLVALGWHYLKIGIDKLLEPPQSKTE